MKSGAEFDEICLMQIFWELDNVLGKSSTQRKTSKHRRRRRRKRRRRRRRRRQQQQQQQQQQIQHICRHNAITIKITVIEYERIYAPELLTTCIVELSSQIKTQYAQEEADLYLTELIFLDALRRLYNVQSATLSLLLVKNFSG